MKYYIIILIFLGAIGYYSSCEFSRAVAYGANEYSTWRVDVLDKCNREVVATYESCTKPWYAKRHVVIVTKDGENEMLLPTDVIVTEVRHKKTNKHERFH